MKTATAIVFAVTMAATITLGAPAQAARAPVKTPSVLAPPDLTAIYTGPAGAMVEHDYFQAPPSIAAGRCTVRMLVFEKTRLAQACY